ncbi:MAG: WG repeat-containing protein [Bacteroidia bacterium]|nr:WG repeat-containing protein [Bacteroidia bacterium]
MNEEIELTIKAYLESIHAQDFDRCYEMLDKDESAEYKKIIQDFAEKMEPFGEADELLKRMQIESLDILRQMSDKEFLVNIFKQISKEVGQKELKRMVESTEILNIDATDYLTIVQYKFSFPMYEGEWTDIETEIHLIFKENRWQILFKPGMSHAFAHFDREIDFYNKRKAMDQPEKFSKSRTGELSSYTVTGYKNAQGEVVFEARFKDAGEFNEGLAYARVFEKYGYIDQTGEFTIKPRFSDAQDFSQGLAAVAIYIPEEGTRWGLIDREGNEVYPFELKEAGEFSDGLMVCSNEAEKWGYLNTSGELVIPFKFDYAQDFYEGEAEVGIWNEDEEMIYMTIDTNGNILD